MTNPNVDRAAPPKSKTATRKKASSKKGSKKS
jgi:hypothetical protein